MTSTPGYFDRKPSSGIRPGLSHLQASPSSPHTPHTPPQNRSITSPISSPSLSYRAEEDALVFEFGARHFSAGFTGESYPRCKLGFGPEESRRAGDYRRCLPHYDMRPRKSQRAGSWGKDQELWRMDIQGFDMGIVEDKLERAVREAYTKHLLLDAKTRRLTVVLPSVVPHQLLSTLLSTLFNKFFVPSITLLSDPILSILAAGCRSGLNVDIGWNETIVTGVYEFREVSQQRTTRAMRAVTLEMARLLQSHDTKAKHPGSVLQQSENDQDDTLSVGLEQAEEVSMRMAWCQGLSTKRAVLDQTSEDASNLTHLSSNAEDERQQILSTENSSEEDALVSVPSPSSPYDSIQVPFSQLASPAEIALLASRRLPHDLDDHEQPLHLLIYNSLLHLPPDVRALCMSRIIFTGGGSSILGLKARLLDELSSLVEKRAWDPVTGNAADKARGRLKEISHNRQLRTTSSPLKPETVNTEMPTIGASQQSQTEDPIDHKLLQKPSHDLQHRTKSTPIKPEIRDPETPIVPASQQPQIEDPIDQRIRHDSEKESKPPVSGVIRGVETLGAWAGASLLANLRIKGIVDIDRESYLQHGMAGARKEADVSAAMMKNVPRAGAMGEKVGWTLGTWA